MLLYLYFFASIILVLLYVNLIYKVYGQWEKAPKHVVLFPEKELPAVTVIVAARNEVAHIKKTIKSLLACDYPSDKLQIIIVDDHSTDGTAEIISAYDEIILLRQIDNSLQGKKHALTKGVRAATGEIILTTDADCIVGDQWIKTIVSSYRYNTKVTTSMISYGEQKSMITQFQQLDLLSTMGITYYGIASHKFYTANGANFSFTKEAFLQYRGYEGNIDYASGDDMFFIQKVAAQEPESIRCVIDKSAIVKTEPMYSLKAFLQQRVRWASKSKAYKDQGIYYPLVLTFLLNASILINIVLIPFFDSITLFILMMQLMLKCIIDYLYLFHLAKYFGVNFKAKHFLACSALFPIYMIFMGTAGLFLKKYEWKGRVLQ